MRLDFKSAGELRGQAATRRLHLDVRATSVDVQCPEARNYQASFNTAGFLVRALFAHRHPCDAGVTVTVFGGNAGTDES